MNEFVKTRSAVRILTPDTDWITEAKAYPYLLAVSRDRVCLLCGNDDLSAETLTELRAFSETEELHVVRIGGKFVGRIRTDGVPDGEETEYIEQKQMLWGKVRTTDGSVPELHDDRGIDIILPKGVTAKPGGRVFLTVRSYLAGDRFAFTDYRLCGLSSAADTTEKKEKEDDDV